MSIAPVSTPIEAAGLDELLWEVLWKPLGLPRDVRQAFKVDGDSMELVAKWQGQIQGGLVAVWTGPGEVELRHLAVKPGAQGRGLGRELVSGLISRIMAKGCWRLHTIARHTSADFFRKMGFHQAPGTPPVHPDFQRQGITLELMEMIIGHHG
ncbi:MAG: GNAT family N-acetyltransferase [Thermodesulfobacteriota bacterium]